MEGEGDDEDTERKSKEKRTDRRKKNSVLIKDERYIRIKGFMVSFSSNLVLIKLLSSWFFVDYCLHKDQEQNYGKLEKASVKRRGGKC